MEIEGGDIAGVSELVGLESIDGIWCAVLTCLWRLEGGIWDCRSGVVNVSLLVWLGQLICRGWNSADKDDDGQDREGDDDFVMPETENRHSSWSDCPLESGAWGCCGRRGREGVFV